MSGLSAGDLKQEGNATLQPAQVPTLQDARNIVQNPATTLQGLQDIANAYGVPSWGNTAQIRARLTARIDADIQAGNQLPAPVANLISPALAAPPAPAPAPAPAQPAQVVVPQVVVPPAQPVAQQPAVGGTPPQQPPPPAQPAAPAPAPAPQPVVQPQQPQQPPRRGRAGAIAAAIALAIAAAIAIVLLITKPWETKGDGTIAATSPTATATSAARTPAAGTTATARAGAGTPTTSGTTTVATGLTEAQIRAIITQAIKDNAQPGLSAADVQRIVDQALANQKTQSGLTTDDVQRIVNQAFAANRAQQPPAGTPPSGPGSQATGGNGSPIRVTSGSNSDGTVPNLTAVSLDGCPVSGSGSNGTYVQSGVNRTCTWKMDGIPSGWQMTVDAIGFQLDDDPNKVWTNTIKAFDVTSSVKIKVTNGAALIGPSSRARDRFCEIVTTADENTWALANRQPLASWAPCPGQVVAQTSSQAPAQPTQAPASMRRPTGIDKSGSFKAHEPVVGFQVTVGGKTLKPQPCYLADPQTDGSVFTGVVNPDVGEYANMAPCTP